MKFEYAVASDYCPVYTERTLLGHRTLVLTITNIYQDVMSSLHGLASTRILFTEPSRYLHSPIGYTSVVISFVYFVYFLRINIGHVGINLLLLLTSLVVKTFILCTPTS